MSPLTYHIFTSTSLITLSLYHLTTVTTTFLKSPTLFISKPLHPFPTTTKTTRFRLRLLPHFLLIISLSLSTLHHLILSSKPDPIIPGQTPVHFFTSLTTASITTLFLIITFLLLLSETTSFSVFTSLNSDLFFAAAASAFYLLSTTAATANSTTHTLYSKLNSTSSLISALSSFLCLTLSLFPRLFILDVGLAASVMLQGFWNLQTGLTLYVDRFIPEGCHLLLDVVSGVDGSTKCDLDESRLRAFALLDFVFVVYVAVVVVVVFAVYGLVCKVLGVSRRVGGYEALPSSGVGDNNHVQLKTLSGTQA